MSTSNESEHELITWHNKVINEHDHNIIPSIKSLQTHDGKFDGLAQQVELSRNARDKALYHLKQNPNDTKAQSALTQTEAHFAHTTNHLKAAQVVIDK